MIIVIGKDKIFNFGRIWIVSLKDGNEEHFRSKKAAINFYCSKHCNPMYNDAHYDCESCPITEAK